VGNASNSSLAMPIKKRAPAHHSSLNTKQDCLKIVDTFRPADGARIDSRLALALVYDRRLTTPGGSPKLDGISL
jgi:hypothetical protein